MDGLQLRSLVTRDGELQLSLAHVPVPEPGADEVVVRVDATPINPSDIGLLFGAADMRTAKTSGTRENPVVTASVPQSAMRAMAARARAVRCAPRLSNTTTSPRRNRGARQCTT